MSGSDFAFYLFAVVAVCSALGVVTLRNVMHSALCLAVTLMSVAGVFVLVNASFVAAVQVILYAGGIMVLIVFAIMLIQRLAGNHQAQTNDQWVVALGTCVAIGIVMKGVIGGTTFHLVEVPSSSQGATAHLGELLLTKYMMPFEIASVVLLAAMIGVVVLAKKEKE